ncbi:MAG: DUF4159 domain-containing protein [Parvibaculum sp.]
MIAFGPLAFTAPWVLLGLLILPLIWWVLRVTPPAPKRIRFPAIRLLLGLASETETPAHTPLWLLLLRLAIAALIVIALANPLWRPAERIAGSGPLLIIIDNGWTSATHWNQATALARSFIVQAGELNRPVALTTSVPEQSPVAFDYETADNADARLSALEPQPLLPHRQDLVTRLETLGTLPDQVIWISDGLDHGHVHALSEYLYAQGVKIDLIEPSPEELDLALLAPKTGEAMLAVPVLRASPQSRDTGALVAQNKDGQSLGRASFTFERDSLQTEALFELPLELRNEITAIRLDRNATAGGTLLLDERWRRRTMGIVSDDNDGQPLLSELYYLERALEPYVDIRKPTAESDESPVANLLSAPLSLLLLADLGRLAEDDIALVRNWVKDGGVLVRFAGPRLAASADDLIPVPLRSGGRDLGGALSWTKPQKLAPFGEESPFFGIAVPNEVTVKRQVLADPKSNLADHTWARLEDGTPLVTARADGSGWIVLVHVTANTDWSNLALSGLYVDMLRRMVELSQGRVTIDADTNAATTLAPNRLLNAYGDLVPPPAWAVPVNREDIAEASPDASHLPGLYGQAGATRALNATQSMETFSKLPELDNLNTRSAFVGESETDMKAPLFVTALLLLLADGIAALSLSGRLRPSRLPQGSIGKHLATLGPRFRNRKNVSALILGLMLLPMALPQDAKAEVSIEDKAALAATLETHLAYVVTGDADIDETSYAGLDGLSKMLSRRTALEPGAPIGVNIETDELAFFPLLYWPISESQPVPSSVGLARLNTYMKQGGTILFDTRDQDRAISGRTTGAGRALKDILSKLDIPPLEPVPADHVLTRSFYLLVDFPGRWEGGQLWIERARDPDALSGSNNDGVSAILIGANDYVGAWARDTSGRPFHAAVPGGEMQREIAARFGINLVMYALTGNYKADQVHIPALLERLGQ